MKDKDKEVIDSIDFDSIREDMANVIGLKKEKLFPNIYGSEKEKEEYAEYCESLIKTHRKGIEEIFKKLNEELGEVIKKYEKRPKE